jgi:hypothetical protein
MKWKHSILKNDVDVVIGNYQVNIFHNVVVFEGFENRHFIHELSFIKTFATRYTFDRDKTSCCDVQSLVHRTESPFPYLLAKLLCVIKTFEKNKDNTCVI